MPLSVISGIGPPGPQGATGPIGSIGPPAGVMLYYNTNVVPTPGISDSTMMGTTIAAGEIAVNRAVYCYAYGHFNQNANPKIVAVALHAEAQVQFGGPGITEWAQILYWACEIWLLRYQEDLAKISAVLNFSTLYDTGQFRHFEKRFKPIQRTVAETCNVYFVGSGTLAGDVVQSALLVIRHGA